jgi:hypothetical protein
MSIQAVAWVLENSQSTGSERLVLIALANHYNQATEWSYPSVDLIADEARVSRATVFRCLERLVALGELEFTRRGPGRGRRNEYRLPFLPEKRSQDETLFKVTRMSEKVSSERIKGLTGETRTIGTVVKDSNPYGLGADASVDSLQAVMAHYVETCREQGVEPSGATKSKLAGHLCRLQKKDGKPISVLKMAVYAMAMENKPPGLIDLVVQDAERELALRKGGSNGKVREGNRNR